MRPPLYNPGEAAGGGEGSGEGPLRSFNMTPPYNHSPRSPAVASAWSCIWRVFACGCLPNRTGVCVEIWLCESCVRVARRWLPSRRVCRRDRRKCRRGAPGGPHTPERDEARCYTRGTEDSVSEPWDARARALERLRVRPARAGNLSRRRSRPSNFIFFLRRAPAHSLTNSGAGGAAPVGGGVRHLRSDTLEVRAEEPRRASFTGQRSELPRPQRHWWSSTGCPRKSCPFPRLFFRPPACKQASASSSCTGAFAHQRALSSAWACG